MDKSTTTGYVLIFLLFIGFFYFTQQNTEEIEKQNAAAADTTIVESAQELSSDSSLALPVISEVDSVNPNEVVEESIKTLKNDKFAIDFTNKGGIPKKLQLLEYSRYDSSELIIFEENQSELSYSIPLANGGSINTLALDFVPTTKGDSSISYTATLPGNAQIIQTYTVKPKSYKVKYDLRFVGMEKIIAPNNRYAEMVWKAKLQGTKCYNHLL